MAETVPGILITRINCAKCGGEHSLCATPLFRDSAKPDWKRGVTLWMGVCDKPYRWETIDLARESVERIASIVLPREK